MMMSFAPALLAKLTVIFATGLILAASLRVAAASLRHLVLLATLVCGLTLPVVMKLSPRWEVAILPQAAGATTVGQSPASSLPSRAAKTVRAGGSQSSEPLAAQSAAITTMPAASATPQSKLRRLLDSGETLPSLIWVFGFCMVVGWLVVGRVKLRRIAREAWPLSGSDWQMLLADARAEAGISSEVDLLCSPVATTPLTWGTVSPVILLPEGALEWPEEHRRVVLRHELAHIARKDSLTQSVTGFICALYWFHPLVWMSERRLRAECERACDDRVVSLGTPAAEYAWHLLEVARSARAFGAAGFLSVAMARPSQLEGRLLAVLNQSRRRVAATPAAKVTAFGVCALVLLPLAAFRPVPKNARATQREARVYRPTLVEYGPNLIVAPDLRTADAAPQVRADAVVSTSHDDADTTFKLSAPARDRGTLNLDLKTGGDVTITGWDRAEVFVRASLGGRDWRETRVTLEPRDGEVTLQTDFIRWSNSQSTRHNFDIQVPRNFNVRLKSSGGSVSIANVSGRFSGSTGGGEITIKNANGEADLRTGGGEIKVEDSNLSGSVSTGGGVIRIVRVNGNLNGSSGSGPVIRADSQSPSSGSGLGIGIGQGGASVTGSDGRSSAIRMSSGGGDLSLPSAPNGARVTTGGGKIAIGPSGGEVYAETGGGPIHIGPASGSVAAHTGAGDVDIELKGSGSHDVEVTSGTGQVVIVAPSDLNATLELETAYTDHFGRKTRVVSDWPVSITETSEWDASHGTPRKYVRVRQNIGRGGGLIRVRTVNGDILLKRARP